VNPNNTASFGNIGLFSGSSSLATVGTVATTCNNWSSNTTGTFQAGIAGFSSVGNWFGNFNVGCGSGYQLVCLEQ
jgi:hypothetical protein